MKKKIDELQEFQLKLDIIKLRATIRELKEAKYLTNLEILRFTYKQLGHILKL